jgi:hypothetical protein
MPTLSKVPLASESQVAVGRLLGLNLQGCSVGVAYAQIEDFLATSFWGQTELGHPSVKQCALAKKFGFSIEDKTRGVGAAVIDDVMFQLNNGGNRVSWLSARRLGSPQDKPIARYVCHFLNQRRWHRLLQRRARQEGVVAQSGARVKAPNPSIELTCPGKPGHAAHVKR